MKAWLEIVVSLLIIAGVAGTIYELLSPIASAFQRSTPAGLAAIGVAGLLGTFAWMARGWMTRGRNAQLVAYAFAGIGLVYLARFWIHGSL